MSNKPRFPDILFPNLLSFTDNKEISSDIYLLFLTYFEKSLVNEKSLGQYKDTIIRDIVNLVKGINEYAFKEGITSIWDDDEYLVIRSKVGIHLDLAGYINDSEVIMALNSTMAMNDMRLKMFAALSLIKHGYELDDKDLMEIAADNEIRNWFYDGLQKIGRIDVFPSQYKTQQYFAESNMVDWLIYPTELARVPDKIELMSVFDDGEEEYYLFRFKCDSNKNWKEEGWMTGISGPFNKKAVPTTSAEGNTFSRFEKWESKTPEEHFEAIVGNVKQYWIKRAEELNG